VLLSSGAGGLLGMLGLACMFVQSPGAAIAIIGAAVVALVVFGMCLARIDMAPQE